MEANLNIGALILAAGESSRMKSPKPLMKFDAKQRFIDKIINEFTIFGIKKIVVVINKNLDNEINPSAGIVKVINENPERGRFSSVRLGLEFLRNFDFCFLHNADNPFITVETLNLLLEKRIDTGYVYPAYNDKGGHPVLLSKTVIESALAEESVDIDFRKFLIKFESFAVEVNDKFVTANINDIEDYNKHFKL